MNVCTYHRSLGKSIQWQFQVADSVSFWFREVSGSHVNLERWQYQLWWVKFSVAFLSHQNVIFFRSALLNVFVVGSLFSESCFGAQRRSVIAINVTNELTSGVWKRQNLLRRTEELLSASIREVASCGTQARHEYSVSSKDGIANEVANTSGSMSWSVQDRDFELSDVELLAFGEELIELRTVWSELIIAQVEERLPGLLHCDDLLSHRNLRLWELGLEVLRSCEMIGVDVSFEYPVQLKTIFVDVRNDGIGMRILDAHGEVVVV